MGKNKKLDKRMSLKEKIILFIGSFFIIIIFVVKVVTELSKSTLDVPNIMRTRGSPGSPIKIVEYIDLQCHFCAQGSQKLRKYMEEHPGIIFLELKYLPLDTYKNSLKAMIYSDCAGKQDKYWPFVDKILDDQVKWENISNVDLIFDQIALDIKLNISELHQCVGDPTVKQAIVRQKTHNESIGLDTIPTYYINNEMLVGDEGLIEKIEAKLGKRLINK